MNQVAQYDPETGELPATTAMSQSLVGQLVKAEIDQQIATAHAYPRSVSRVVRNVLSLVTISPAAAEECGYALPRGKKPILGPSIRLAEIVAGQWGNCRVGARVVHVDRFEKYVEAEGVFHDLETNTATTARVRRRIVDSQGRLYNDDMIVVTGNAACSIAKRNAILAGVPKAVWNEAYETAMKTVKGEVKTLPERREKAFKAFAAFGIKPDQIFAALEVEGEEDIGLEELATLLAMHKAIKDGDQKVEDYFPDMGKRKAGAEGDGAPKGTAAKLADIGKGKGDNPAQDKAAREQAAQDRADADRAETQHKADVAQRAAETTQEGGQASGAADTPAGDDKPASDPENGAGDNAPAISTGEERIDPKDAEADAYARGRKAFTRGQKADACPPDLRKTEALAEAWLAGWKDARDEAGED
jgi:ribosome modulation factor